MDSMLNISFGDRVAENESQDLSVYFIKTEHWEKLVSGKADIVFGSKGAGKVRSIRFFLNNLISYSKMARYLFQQRKQLGKPSFQK